MANPYGSHPIYWLRLYLLVLAIFSETLGSFACAVARWDALPWALHLLWTCCSALWCISDLVHFALQKASDPDAKPKWPKKKTMIGDAIFTILFGLSYVYELTTMAGHYSSNIMTTYASVTTLFYV